mgnify:CR=1 FL=1
MLYIALCFSFNLSLSPRKERSEMFSIENLVYYPIETETVPRNSNNDRNEMNLTSNLV